ncbi:hypothetical protein TrLO_g10369 [Triparma laevis f. longispina]|uniref:PhoD-like phosphatase metallophosphatase domain-containing protein n=1 Tax=Triparma laevis f. longispina TaxID=1714387 RepID=A0A9W6ZI26_9STRA|nr:hypothetical protein TrLO_g10369 [Triparma laevis f. longispina]
MPLTLAFGSCHRLHPGLEEQNLLSHISSQNPYAYLWLGDAVYADKRNNDIEGLREAYDTMLSYPPYSKLLKQVRGRIYGTWDDHDYGLNDAGKYLDDKESRKLLYLNFLNVNSDDVRRNRDGVYHTINIKENRENVKVIFLDTRTFRENHYIPSVGGIPFPLSPVIAAFSRFLVKMLGLGSNFTGDVLGEEQWEWLESELVHDGGVNIIVSSIQVLTTNPLVESWGHFPKEKRKFLELLDSSKTKTIVLSGDVHHAEFSKVGDVVEITSSGLTHSCSGPFYGFVCDIMLRTFEQHRLEGFYWVKENFGVLRIQEGEVGVEVYDGEGNVVGETRVGEREGGIVWEEVPQLLDGRVSWNFVGFVGGLLLVAVVMLRILIGFVGRWRKKKKNSKKKIS